VHSQSIRVSSMGAGVQTQFTCEDACVQTQFTSMDAGVHTQFTLKDACVQTQFTFQDAVKTWIDRSTAQKGFTGQIALQYLIQGLESSLPRVECRIHCVSFNSCKFEDDKSH